MTTPSGAPTLRVTCERCKHGREHHGRERDLYDSDYSKREVCLVCPGYEDPGYPHGKAWHRFKAATEPYG